MATTTEEKIRAEMEKAKGLKISEMKMKLMAKGVLTSTFVEKDEFVRAYAEVMVKESESSSTPSLGGLASVTTVTDDDDNSDDEGVTEELPLYMKQRVDKLKELHEERDATMREYLKERAALEAKYERISLPFFEQRAEVVAGGMDEEIAASAASGGGGSEPNNDANDEPKDKGIPQFWACAIHQMPVTQGLVQVHDLECLASLADIRCLNKADGTGFQLEFDFGPNDFFSNTTLTKTYEVPNLLLGDEPILQKVEGCTIDWKPGKSLVETTVTRQQKGTGKNAGQTRTRTKTTKRDSFFGFFAPPRMPASMASASEEEVLKLEQAFDEDYDIAQAFRSHIVPKAVLWFAGDAMEQEMEAAMEGMGFPPAEAAASE